jgi:hypothetical protein
VYGSFLRIKVSPQNESRRDTGGAPLLGCKPFIIGHKIKSKYFDVGIEFDYIFT